MTSNLTDANNRWKLCKARNIARSIQHAPDDDLVRPAMDELCQILNELFDVTRPAVPRTRLEELLAEPAQSN
jgi:hypothetical protein